MWGSKQFKAFLLKSFDSGPICCHANVDFVCKYSRENNSH